jgi:hypothetical protein
VVQVTGDQGGVRCCGGRGGGHIELRGRTENDGWCDPLQYGAAA